MSLWMLIATKKVTKESLEKYYSMDDALKLTALHQMMDNTTAIRADKSAKKLKRGRK